MGKNTASPLCNICNHEHGRGKPHVFGTEVPRKPRSEPPRPASAENVAGERPAGHAKEASADPKVIDAKERLAQIRANKAAQMQRYRAKLKTIRAD